jgi:hypothetical protein
VLTRMTSRFNDMVFFDSNVRITISFQGNLLYNHTKSFISYISYFSYISYISYIFHMTYNSSISYITVISHELLTNMTSFLYDM